MTPAYLAYAPVALGLAAVATPIAIQVARRLDIMDHPDTLLKPHARAMPYLGGVAMGLAWAGAILAATLFSPLKLPPMLGWIVGGGLAIAALGTVDDKKHISPKLRLALSTIIVGGVMVASGAGMQIGQVVAGMVGLDLPIAVAVPLSLGVGVFIVLGACNSTNLIDGLDGLCAGVSCVVCVVYFLLGAALMPQMPGDAAKARLILAAAMTGATGGFLLWNFKPAKIFMGDGGSLLLGFNSGMLMLLFADAPDARWLLGALVIFTLPVFDTALAMFRRWNSGKPIFVGDRSHFYDQLVQRGLTVRQTVLVCYAVTAAFGAIGLIVIWTPPWPALLIFAGVALLTWTLAHAAGMTRGAGE
ncbi:WecA-like glycosyltransferase [Phycisphaerae bacterium RAS1]|nr:WecA-like glycosyltransferase [Phycisphaerae bacterium RAS1]